MIHIQHFTFGAFSENTYLLWDETKSCIVIDPGNSDTSENQKLTDFINKNELKLERLILTHGHIDHINGNKYIFEKYGLLPEVHLDDLFFIQKHAATAAMYGLMVDESPLPEKYIKEGDVISFGTSELETIHTPGHSPGSITFFNKKEKLIISGDVLFNGSVGRSDLPMGNHQVLMKSITEKLLPLGDDMTVYSGHGPKTTIGSERMYNPFLNG